MEAEAPSPMHGSEAVLSPPTSPSQTRAIGSLLWSRAIAGAGIVLALGVIFLACLKPHGADDFYWQARTGQIILQSRHLPHVDPFSWTAHGRPWTVHGWLSMVLFYLMAARLPLWTIVLYKCGLAALACGLLLWRAWLRSGSWLLALGVTLLASFTLPGWANVRPEMLTLLLFAALLLGLDLYCRGRVRSLPFVLPIAFVLWANLHPSAAIGLALVCAWTLGEWAGSRNLPERRDALRRLALGLAASAVAVALNPEGFGLYLYPVHMLRRSIVTDNIAEWSSPDFHIRTVQYFAILLLGTPFAMALAGRQRGWGVGDVFLLFCMASAALLYSRDIAPFAIAAAPVFASAIVAAWQQLERPGPILSFVQRPSWQRACAAAVVLLLAVLVFRRLPRNDEGRVPPREWLSYTLGLDVLPRQGAMFLASGQCPGRLYNDFDWGGYLIWRLWPQRPVFIDRRADLYLANGVFRDRTIIEAARPGWQEVLDRRGVQVVLTHRRSDLYNALLESPKWHLAFSGDVEDVLVRVAPQ